jgi:ElaB/YqjD/DUF883 family membrane-anchored ribosome-binding protein
VADQVTPDSGKTPDEIEQEMFETREALTEKVAALEHQVVGTVQTAADTINDTVEAVKSLVTGAPEAVSDTLKQAAATVSETMKDTLDITGHVRRHPWGAVGVSATLGCVAGWLLSRPRSLGASPGYTPALAGAAAEVMRSPTPIPEPAPTSAPQQPGMFDELLGIIGAKVKEVARTALDSVAAALKENIQTGVPTLVGQAAARLADMGSPSNSPSSSFAADLDARRFPG